MYTEGIEACLARKAEGEGDNGDGGGAVKSQDFDAAAVAALYGNRAASHVMILGYEQAIADCDRAVELNPSFANAVFRKAMALKKLVRRGGRDIEKCQVYAPGRHEKSHARM